MAGEAGREAAARPSVMDIWVRALGFAAAVDNHPGRTFPDVVASLAAQHGERPALLSDRETLSFADLDRRADRYAGWALDHGIAKGDVVALMMPNRPDYLAAWIGITRIGGVAALINTNLMGPALAHCIAAAAPALAIVEASLRPAWRSAEPLLGTPPRLWVLGEGEPEDRRLDGALASRPDGALPEGARPTVTTADAALLIYTSGTTGLPKAARVSHHRVMMWSHFFAGLIGTTPDDRMYDCLPLYHSVGGVVATGAALVGGGSVVIAEKFSAKGFWSDVIRWDCTLVQYIGELCRFLLKAPPAATDTAHRLRLACGNGLRGDVWEPFRERFAIPKILEFYAATEGNFSLYNVEGKPGAIGRIPAFMAARFPAAIVRHDPETERPARDEAGLCIRCARDEPGEAIGRIDADEPARAGRFEGYTTRQDTDRKILRDVFKPGDAWFRTGDLMRLDRQGYFTFVDRVGDTFRWKGENVATTEVAAALAACPGVVEALVYGVAVPGADGKAGMATLVADGRLDLVGLRRHLAERLPPYARPLFLRLREAVEMTETFKPKKGDLVNQGFDPGMVADPLFVDDASQGGYVRLDAAAFDRIARGDMRL